jgi:D-amino-acid dehydrogenase
MKIAVLGAGVVGVTCAWELMRDGHEVVLVEKEQGAALGTSFGNAGFISPGHAYAWASPKAPGILLRSLYRGDQALRFKPSLDPALWRWMVKFLGQCNAERAAWNTGRKVALCVYSKRRLNLIAEETGIAFDHLKRGCVYLFRSQAGLEAGARKAQILIDQGVEVEAIDMDRAAEIDPAFAELKGSSPARSSRPRTRRATATPSCSALPRCSPTAVPKCAMARRCIASRPRATASRAS